VASVEARSTSPVARVAVGTASCIVERSSSAWAPDLGYTKAMELPAVIEAVAGVPEPHISADQGSVLYTWFLEEQLEEHADDEGVCTPAYDFAFLDGSKNWTIDGLAVLLLERLLTSGGWLLLDDLDWSYAARKSTKDTHYFVSLGHLTQAELDEPHIRAVFDLIVRPHPSFTDLVIQDGSWAWARKAPGEPRRLRIETTKTPAAYVVEGTEIVRRRFRDARRRLGSAVGAHAPTR
jgi:hypothetical protein